MRGSRPRIDLLLAGCTLPPIQARYGDFDEWFQGRAATVAEFRMIRLYAGEPLPDLPDSDGWIISGSPASLSDDLPWLPDAKAGIARAVESGHPILGVCFGHQLLAASTGGVVAANPKGWELGLAVVNLTRNGTGAGLFKGLGSSFPVYESHQDVVVKLPDTARILAENDMGIQAFQTGARAFGVQFHPEFTNDIIRMYIQLRTGSEPPSYDGLAAQADRANLVLKNYIENTML